MQRQEGFFPGSRSYRNNNPGNIWDGLAEGKARRIWPDIPVDSEGFLIFPTYEAGRAAFERQLSIKVNRGLSLEGLLAEWAPASENDTAAYVRNVSGWLSIPADVPLLQLDSGDGLAWPAGRPAVDSADLVGLAASLPKWVPWAAAGVLALAIAMGD
ncbi:hypothetical protein EPO44_10225 [bacterium]|nr:MAG: hypothetical protein EPO44_10225 [bacterium]